MTSKLEGKKTVDALVAFRKQQALKTNIRCKRNHNLDREITPQTAGKGD